MPEGIENLRRFYFLFVLNGNFDIFRCVLYVFESYKKIKGGRGVCTRGKLPHAMCVITYFP